MLDFTNNFINHQSVVLAGVFRETFYSALNWSLPVDSRLWSGDFKISEACSKFNCSGWRLDFKSPQHGCTVRRV